MPVADPKLIYWDADACLAYLLPEIEDDRLFRCEATLAQAKAGHIRIVTSTLTLAEVIYLKGSPHLPPEQDEIIRNFFLHEFIVIHDVDRKIAEAARQLVWKRLIKPRDAIHVATAIKVGAAVLETFDQPLITRSGTVGDPPLTIAEPQNPLTMGLLAEGESEADDHGNART